jgi:hypothetical protein
MDTNTDRLVSNHEWTRDIQPRMDANRHELISGDPCLFASIRGSIDWRPFAVCLPRDQARAGWKRPFQSVWVHLNPLTQR